MSGDLVPSGGGGLPAAGGGAEPYVDLSRQGERLPSGKAGELAARDERDMTDMVAILRGELGSDLEVMLAFADEAAVKEWGEETWMDLAHSRMPDGSLVGNNADLVRSLCELARLDLWLKQIAESGASLPRPSGGGGGSSNAIDTEIARLEAMMGTPEFYTVMPSGDGLKTFQRRLYELLALRHPGGKADDYNDE